jgi:ABC-2 type transport system permease protein
MTRTVGAELLKLRTARTFWALAAAALLLVVIVTVLTLALSSSWRTEDDARSVLATGGITGLFLLILGVVFSAGEYRHGTIASTLLVTPDRLRVVSAQALACAILGLVVASVAVALTAAIGLPWLAAKDATSLSAAELLGLFAGGVLYTALAGALGAGLGALVRNQIAAVIVLLMVLFVIDPTLSALIDGYAKYSLGGLGSAISGGAASDAGADDLLPVWAAVLIWAAYTGVLVGAAAWLTSRRDI